MIPDLDESLKDLIVAYLQLPPGEVEVSFDPPTADWSAPLTRPTINLFLYDLRENVKLRETAWTQTPSPKQATRVQFQRAPLRVDLSYMITCWTSASEDQHRLLWAVLECLLRNSALPEPQLRGDLRALTRGVRLEVAQTEGVLSNLSDYWTALGNPIRPSINLVATVELDLKQLSEAPMVGAREHRLRLGVPTVGGETPGPHPQTWGNLVLGRSEIGGLVRHQEHPVPAVAVRLLSVGAGGHARQVGPSVTTDAQGRFRMRQVPNGSFTLIIEREGASPHALPVVIGRAGERAGSPSPLIVDLPDPETPSPDSAPPSDAPPGPQPRKPPPSKKQQQQSSP